MYLINPMLNKTMRKLSILILFILIALPLTLAIPTVSQNENVFISRTATSNGAITSSVSCNISVRDPDGLTIVPLTGMTFNATSGQQEFFIDGANHTKFGIYTYPVSCTNGEINNTKIKTYEVNPSGKAYIPGITGPLIFAAIISLMFVSFFLLFVGWKIDLFPVKVFLIILAGLVAIMNIGFIAGSFQEFFSPESALSGSFGTLYIIFIMLLTASSIFLLIWILLAAVKVYRIKRGFFVAEE